MNFQSSNAIVRGMQRFYKFAISKSTLLGLRFINWPLIDYVWSTNLKIFIPLNISKFIKCVILPFSLVKIYTSYPFELSRPNMFIVDTYNIFRTFMECLHSIEALRSQLKRNK